MQIQKFAPITCMYEKINRTVPGVWPIGIDYGFSGVKGFAPNKYFSFPNCALMLKGDEFSLIGDPSPSDIVIRDSEGIWVIGEQALSLMDSDTAHNYEMETYGRNRYYSPVFRAIMKTGLAFGLMGSQGRAWNPSTDKVVIQTGLPPKHRAADSGFLRDAIAGEYNFEVKFGSGPFQRFVFSVRPEDIYIMDQPMGALISSMKGTDGLDVRSQRSIMVSNTLVMDPGFKTLDICNLFNRRVKDSQTYDNLGMQEVYSRTAAEILERYHRDMSIPEMQVAVKNGSFNVFDRKNMRTAKIYFEDIMNQKNHEVCMEALNKILNNYDGLLKHENLVITGGTGDAWYKYITDYMKGWQNTLNTICANRNDPSISNVFSNVRGYYFWLVDALSRAQH